MLLLLAATTELASAQWTPPTPEELAMTSVPQVPGAPAVYLYKEQELDGITHVRSYYVRLKVLTEGGKDLANVELPYVEGVTGWAKDSISGRTVHPDGSITPFTGTPYDKLIQNIDGVKVNAKVFSLPAVEIGSILEYRYKLNDGYSSPDWYLQSDLFVRKAHYSWRLGAAPLWAALQQTTPSVVWTPILPPGAAVQKTSKGGTTLELDVSDIPPLPHESNMPPLNSLSYRVLFYYTGFKTTQEYWTKVGKYWSETRDKFMEPGSATKSEVKALLHPGDSDEQKVRAIYAFIGTLDNTAFSRTHTTREDRAQGFKEINKADDILKRRRGTDDELTELFVSMVRAAGVKAYLMGVSNRDKRVFVPSYLDLGQMDDYIAVASVAGREVFLDPGQRFCPYGHLSWQHSMAMGLRQTEGGTDLVTTPVEPYKEAHVSRVADLVLDEYGGATGTITITSSGDPALHWRQQALRGDDTSLNNDLRTSMQDMLPGGMEVRITKVDNLADAAQPLKVVCEVKGNVGALTGKRLLLPASLFEANSKARFTAERREMPVDMRYASYVQDAVRFTLPPQLTVESAPADARDQLRTYASYTTSVKSAPGSITLYRNLINGRVIYATEEYPDLRAFYSRMQARDQESLVLTRGAATVAPPGAGEAH